jgi:heptosyltransferase-1
MKILIIKMSSLGDVIHNLPAITDIRAHIPEARIDWVVEESFADIPAMHPGIDKVIPIGIRRWRKSWFGKTHQAQITQFKEELKKQTYDVVLDTQGLFKSGLVTRHAKGKRVGYNWKSAREPLASLFYDVTHSVPAVNKIHAVERNRRLAAAEFGYQLGPLDYGLYSLKPTVDWLPNQPYMIGFHAASRASKLWPEENWIELANHYAKQGIVCILPWGSKAEHERSLRMAEKIKGAIVPPKLNLRELAGVICGSQFTVGVDTGLSHFAAALKKPIVAIYCATNPKDTGVYTESPAINIGEKNVMPSVAQALEAMEKIYKK